jgi:norsolorinic acid ketoreductase
MTQTVSLVTGANRGIGKGLVTELLKREDAIVIGTVRDTNSTSSKDLENLAKGQNSRLILVKLDAESETDAIDAAKMLRDQHNITHIDTIIANAGISNYFGPVATTPASQVLDHFRINTLGPLLLFQAFAEFLEASEQPKFVVISTGIASIGDMGSLPIPAAAYGVSKAAINYITRKIHFENENLVAFVISPGWVQTEMGNAGAVANGMEQAPVTLEDSVNGVLGKVDKATREGMGGTFQSFDETAYAW